MPITLAEMRVQVLDGAKAYTDLALGTVTAQTITAPTEDAVNAFVDARIGDAMDLLGLPRSSWSGATDDDLAAIPDGTPPQRRTIARLKDEARKRTYEFLLGRLRLFTQTSGNQKQQLVELITQLERMIAALAVEIRNRYGPSNPGGAAAVALTSGPDRGAGGLYPYRGVPPSDCEPWRFP